MPVTRKTILRHIFIPLAYGVGIGGFLTFILNWKFDFTWQVIRNQFLYSIILSFFFWKGSSLIIQSLNKKHSWVKETKLIFFRHILFTLGYAILVIFLFYLYIWMVVMHKKNLHGFFPHFKVGFYICFSITAIMILINYSYHFFKDWKAAVINEEKLKRESLLLQYESLKNQVNPHFLFNSFNVLTSLIERDQATSIKYVKQLSEVFRYVLDQNYRELVSIDTELRFIESYLFLQQIRFGANFTSQINLKENDFLLVPLALQLLIENAVKHNEISGENPLSIQIYDDEEYLIVTNNLQPRSNLPESNHIGLSNLDFQYKYLSGKNIEVIRDKIHFTVKLPKLKKTHHADTGR
jgi:sensor histidine kinase YesM